METGVAVVTGASRSAGIGAAIAESLAADGWDLALTYWTPYDARMPWGAHPQDVTALVERIGARGVRVMALEADLSDPAAPVTLFDAVERTIGPPGALILSHCESVASGILDTTIESFDRHFVVNARGSWLLIREFAQRFAGPAGSGRIIALTSDHTVGNLPYGASKGALDRITLAAARELAQLGITANVINPGATDTGWMTSEQKAAFAEAHPWGRVGLPSDCARLVSFLCSEAGHWVNGQLLSSNGGSG